MEPNILIAAPVRDRGWILPHYLDCLAELDYPPEKLRFFFVVNDSSDDSEEILREWAEGRNAEVRVVNLGAEKDDRDIQHRQDHIYGGLAYLRNLILAEARPGEHLFFCDSDILVEPDTLRRLAGHNKALVSATISNVKRGSSWRLSGTNASASGAVQNNLVVPDPWKTGLRPVAWTGAVMLISPDVLGTGPRFKNSPLGEDYPFCQAVRERGLDLWQDGDCLALHCLDVWDLLAALDGRYWEDGYALYLREQAYQGAKEEILEGCRRCCGSSLTAPDGGLGCALIFSSTSREESERFSWCRLPVLWGRLRRKEILPQDVDRDMVDSYWAVPKLKFPVGWAPPGMKSENFPFSGKRTVDWDRAWPSVRVFIPLRNRAWVLPDLLENIDCWDYPGELRFLFLVNHSPEEGIEETRKILRGYSRYHANVETEEWKATVVTDRRWNFEVRKKIYPYLAKIRNRGLDWGCQGEGNLLFFLDSDVMMPTDGLSCLVQSLLALPPETTAGISAVVSNDLPGNRDGLKAVNAARVLETRGDLVIASPREEGVHKREWTGAALLLSMVGLESGARYAGSDYGEDYAFCQEIKARGLSLYQDGDVVACHLLTIGGLMAYREGRYWDDDYVLSEFESAHKRSVDLISRACKWCLARLGKEEKIQLFEGGRLECPIGFPCLVVERWAEIMGGSFGDMELEEKELPLLVPPLGAVLAHMERKEDDLGSVDSEDGNDVRNGTA